MCSHQPLFSVVIPTYNRADFLPQVLSSILAQTFTDFEVWVIDDGSTDHTPSLMQQWQARDRRICYHRKANEERSIARNTGFHLARGRYVVFHDSDDFMTPEHLQTLAQAIASHPQACFLTTKFVLQTPQGILYDEINQLKGGWYDYKLFLRGNPIGIFVCVRKDCADVQLFPPQFHFCEDWIFHILNYRRHRLLLIDKITNIVQIHTHRSMTNHRRVIAGRIAATEFILSQAKFNPREEAIIWGNTYRFCAIHSYLDFRYRESLRYAWLAIGKLGITLPNVRLLAKLLLGRKIVLLIKSALQKLKVR